MPERDVKAAAPVIVRLAAGPPHERQRARGQARGLGGQPLAPVAADLGAFEPEALAQAQGLGEIARGHLHLVPSRAQALDHGAHHEHVRAVCEVDPDSHRRGR